MDRSGHGSFAGEQCAGEATGSLRGAREETAQVIAGHRRAFPVAHLSTCLLQEPDLRAAVLPPDGLMQAQWGVILL